MLLANSSPNGPAGGIPGGAFLGCLTPKVFVGKDLRQHNPIKRLWGTWAVDRVMQIHSVLCGPARHFSDFQTVPNSDSVIVTGQITI